MLPALITIPFFEWFFLYRNLVYFLIDSELHGFSGKNLWDIEVKLGPLVIVVLVIGTENINEQIVILQIKYSFDCSFQRFNGI